MSTIDRVPEMPASARVTSAHVAATSAGGEPEARPASRVLAALRLATGFVFLWAFVDKLLGLGYATEAGSAWVDGESPTSGFLSSISVGPFQDTYNGWAGQAWVDWLFMVGMGAVGLAVMLGVGLRVAAVSGTLMMGFLWASQWPPARYATGGEPTRSNNPLVDSHVIYALALIVLAATYAGDRWGLGRVWARVPLVRRYPSLLR